MNFLSILILSEGEVAMRLVYRLEYDLERDRERVSLAQNLTLDKTRPLMGLKGVCGLFGSSDWWSSIRQGEMPLLFVSGIVLRAYSRGGKISAN